jgi:hypothetical protein
MTEEKQKNRVHITCAFASFPNPNKKNRQSFPLAAEKRSVTAKAKIKQLEADPIPLEIT